MNVQLHRDNSRWFDTFRTAIYSLDGANSVFPDKEYQSWLLESKIVEIASTGLKSPLTLEVAKLRIEFVLSLPEEMIETQYSKEMRKYRQNLFPKQSDDGKPSETNVGTAKQYQCAKLEDYLQNIFNSYTNHLVECLALLKKNSTLDSIWEKYELQDPVYKHSCGVVLSLLDKVDVSLFFPGYTLTPSNALIKVIREHWSRFPHLRYEIKRFKNTGKPRYEFSPILELLRSAEIFKDSFDNCKKSHTLTEDEKSLCEDFESSMKHIKLFRFTDATN